MIRSFADKDTETLFGDKSVRRFAAIERIARRKLLLLHRAGRLGDLRTERRTMSRSSIITDADGLLLDPVHPGEILLEEFLKPLGISQNRLARDVGVPVSRVAGIVGGHRAITADTALRLARYFATSPDLWLGLQVEHDLRVARRLSGAEIEQRVQVLAA